MSMYENILFDLDGTLTDPKDGIVRCIQYALEESGQTVPQGDSLDWCIGPPLQESFAVLLPELSSEGIRSLIGSYRRRYAEKGMFENFVYGGIHDLLSALFLKKKIFVATSKPHFFAEPILNHFHLSRYFHGIYGSELSGERSNKGDLIRHILDVERIPASRTVIIGDRRHDILGGKKAGIRSIGVTWGYGSRDELVEAGADFIVDHPKSLETLLLSND